MAAFQSMLQEYLKCKYNHTYFLGMSLIVRIAYRLVIPVDQTFSSPNITTQNKPNAAAVEEYVYDLYFRDVRPEAISGVAAMGFGVGDGVRGIGAL